MPKNVLLEDDGLITFELGGKRTEAIDLYWINNKILAILALARSVPAEEVSATWFESILQVMQELGLPKCSYRLAEKFAQSVFTAVAELKKKDGALMSAAVPESTASASSDLRPEDVTDSL